MVYHMITRDDIHRGIEEAREREARVFRPGAPQSEGAPTIEQLFVELAGLNERFTSDLKTVIQKGAPTESLKRLMAFFNLPKSDMLDIVAISPATYARRTKTQAKLTSAETDRLYRYARILSLATNMFHGDREEALHWLKSPAYAFKGETPLDHAKTEFGAHEVETLIGRIRHGIPS
jgi:putative toxin-antitoxin system antitoxin component (TIGR02293 family)